MAAATRPKVVITGATGLLGRALLAEFSRAGSPYDVVGTAFSRAAGPIKRVDLTDAAAVRAFVEAERPAVLVHAAAERRPDVCEGDERATTALNVTAVAGLVAAAKDVGAWPLCLSTDYVFDGTAAPYSVDAAPNPLNKYGVSKRAGEVAALEAHPEAAVLRVPILYGPSSDFNESAVTVVAKAVRNHDAPVAVDAWASRYPTYTEDVAVVIRQMADAKVAGKDMSGVFHWSGDEALTKFDQACIMGEVLGVPVDHLAPNSEPPSGAPRPRDCHLDTSRLESLGIGQRTPFRTAITRVLEECVAAETVTAAPASTAVDS